MGWRSCEPFDLSVPDVSAALESVRHEIESRGGKFDGNSSGGEFLMPVPYVGDVKGYYTVQGNTFRIEIVRKPWMVSCREIEERIREGAEREP